MDFFTVPALTSRVLFVLFVIKHGRRRVLRVNVTQYPQSEWVIQELREAFPFEEAPRYLIDDNDTKFCEEVGQFLESIGTKPKRIALRSPWKNGIAEDWVGSIRRELLDHVVPLGEKHLLRLFRAWFDDDHADRTHLGLSKDCPGSRDVTPRPSESAKIIALPRVGEIHHRDVRLEAA